MFVQVKLAKKKRLSSGFENALAQLLLSSINSEIEIVAGASAIWSDGVRLIHLPPLLRTTPRFLIHLTSADFVFLIGLTGSKLVVPVICLLCGHIGSFPQITT